MRYFTINKLLSDAVDAVEAMPTRIHENTDNVVDNDYGVRTTPFCRTLLLPAITETQSLGIDGYNRYYGIYQISVFTPYTHGVAGLNKLVDRIVAAFPLGRTLVEDNVCVRILQITRNGSTQTNTMLLTPVDIQWECFLQR